MDTNFTTSHTLNRLGDNLYEVMITERHYVRLQVSVYGKWIGQMVTVDHQDGPKVVAPTIDQAIEAACKAYDWYVALPKAITITKDRVTAVIDRDTTVTVPLVSVVRQDSYAARIADPSGRQYPVSSGHTFLVAMREAYTTWQVNQ